MKALEDCGSCGLDVLKHSKEEAIDCLLWLCYDAEAMRQRMNDAKLLLDTEPGDYQFAWPSAKKVLGDRSQRHVLVEIAKRVRRRMRAQGWSTPDRTKDRVEDLP